MNETERISGCPDADTLAAFAEGKLQRREMAPILEHLDGCDRCAMAFEAVNEHIAAEGQTSATSGKPWWWITSVAAALVVIVLAIPFLREQRSPMARLVALAPRAKRPVEPRLTGGFRWAAYAGADRATNGAADAERMKLAGAAGELVARADRERDADAQHAAGVALVLVQSPVDAMARLEAAARDAPDAKTWSDLAAARYAAASQLGRASLYPTALAATDAALQIDPRLAEALFNRALILERMGLTAEARRAWERYLEVDASSPWATEARQRLAELPAATSAAKFDRDRPLIENAAARGDAATVRKLVDAHRDRARAFAETEYLNRWGMAVQRGDANETVRWLSFARAVGDALVQLSGESLARDAVRAIDTGSDADRKRIANAHVLYRAARFAYSRGQLDIAQRDLRKAAAEFEATRDPMALAARYYAASVRLSQNQTNDARVELEGLRLEGDRKASLLNLQARVRWELGRAHMLDDDSAGAVPILEEGASLFRRAGDRASEAFVEAMMARALIGIGRADESWLARIRAFRALSAEGEPALLATSVQAAMQLEGMSGRHDAAVALSALAMSVAETAGDSAQIDALTVHATLRAQTDPGDAMRAARKARAIAEATPDASMRARFLGDVDAATGAALVATDPRAASASLTRAITFYEAHEVPFALPVPLLLRARCAEKLGDVAAALRDLRQGMDVIERRRESTDGISIPSVVDEEYALFTDAIRLTLDRNDPQSAFTFAERLGRGSITIPELQQRLRGSGVAVIEVVSLPNELVTFAVSADDLAVARRTRSNDALASLAAEALTETGTTAAATLYDDVIRPVDAVLSRAREIVIVPDDRLRGVPFAALYDARQRRHLIERFPVSIASSAASLTRETAHDAAPSLVAIPLPASSTAPALPEAEREIADIAAEYRHATSMASTSATLEAVRDAAASAGVLHIAGHTEAQRGGGEQALVMKDGPVSWKTILGRPRLRASVVVLAACETLRPPASTATRGRSLGAAFAAAGATDVFGTLAPMGDRDARLFFRALHRRLANAVRPAEALRDVMREAIANDRDGRHAWRAVALLTTRIHVDT
ncbi:MAG: CHAT domain-containing protein [Acidobacteriota bacterium]